MAGVTATLRRPGRTMRAAPSPRRTARVRSASPSRNTERSPALLRSMRPVLVVSCLLVAAGAVAHAADAPFASNDHGLDRRNLDTAVSPCSDFYRYANGGWLDRNPIPADQSSWGITSEMRERNYVLLRQILDESAGAKGSKGSNVQK